MFAQKKGDLPLICPLRTLTWKIIFNPSDHFDFIWLIGFDCIQQELKTDGPIVKGKLLRRLRANPHVRGDCNGALQKWKSLVAMTSHHRISRTTAIGTTGIGIAWGDQNAGKIGQVSRLGMPGKAGSRLVSSAI
jgi:hypothetical protein